jgi:hypothetical protein
MITVTKAEKPNRVEKLFGENKAQICREVQPSRKVPQERTDDRGGGVIYIYIYIQYINTSDSWNL